MQGKCELCGKLRHGVDEFDSCEICRINYGIDYVKSKWQERQSQSDGSSMPDLEFDDTGYLEVV